MENTTLQEKIKTEISAHEFAIIYNLTHVIQGLLLSLVLKHEDKELRVGEIEHLIRTVVGTTFYNGPEHEEYPDFDRENVGPIVKRLASVLSQYGIKSSKDIA